ncbi:MAG TPA: hypothetical protein VGR54_04025 [Nitrosopumilaceae archaeon]|nr:hypothetical protein [Nitrosopumilaceae archaeon]
MSQVQERWKKGKFHRGELDQFIKICSPEELSLICLAGINPEQENDKGAQMARVLVTYMTLSKMLQKNKRKTVTAPRLAKRYKTERNARIRKKLTDIFSFRRTSKIHKEPEIVNNKDNLQADNKKPSYDDLMKKIHEYESRYGKDWEHLHRRNLDESGDTTSD